MKPSLSEAWCVKQAWWSWAISMCNLCQTMQQSSSQDMDQAFADIWYRFLFIVPRFNTCERSCRLNSNRGGMLMSGQLFNLDLFFKTPSVWDRLLKCCSHIELDHLPGLHLCRFTRLAFNARTHRCRFLLSSDINLRAMQSKWVTPFKKIIRGLFDIKIHANTDMHFKRKVIYMDQTGKQGCKSKRMSNHPKETLRCVEMNSERGKSWPNVAHSMISIQMHHNTASADNPMLAINQPIHDYSFTTSKPWLLNQMEEKCKVLKIYKHNKNKTRKIYQYCRNRL